MAQIAGPNDSYAPIFGQMQNLSELINQIADMVASALFSKLAKMGQIFTNLGGTNAQSLA